VALAKKHKFSPLCTCMLCIREGRAG